MRALGEGLVDTVAAGGVLGGLGVAYLPTDFFTGIMTLVSVANVEMAVAGLAPSLYVSGLSFGGVF